MKFVSYNVNGIRAALKKGLDEWVKENAPDVICFQEVKALEEQVDLSTFKEMGYEIDWFSAEKKGYSGVATFSKKKPDAVVHGMGMEIYDKEGRVLRTDYGDTTLLNVYMPSGTSGDARQDFKYQWLDDFFDYVTELRKERPKLIICGDYNICHKPIDIHNPVSNKNSSGFLPEERAWMTKFIESGFVDTFRYFNEESHHYTWWTYRAGARGKNKGWRIDYFMATETLSDQLKGADIHPDAVHSDHCPISVNIEM
ncbi:exodeoxyribonuclease III [Flammeovirgaceae bacterium SG7u.111]|nr:exodeoxyribonuclease III [Flammeovirgaceae bacterium SG7u.132]WPO35515.1 exodeoxyribonuclease III [Flammeovirgaceae bacterium SG7u.111]